ncbi:hypothetical protein GJ697_28925 [Pseudoduganella sp. FT25W]|uniref:Uncharacterized protein n=1 Tax=Duganella alba TaxID=2666081 RepID=A0A6L5QPX8_9BURK|nr:hypothetical protein [Duganella alba]MRX11860.1 hypothetical protein [Duganella alba]MRX20243.1 hypothetical protein [Duganella alba]
MIVALTGMDGDCAVADLAEDLAMLRVAAGKRVLLVSPNPGPYDAQLYDDLVIDASQRDDLALARANVVLALLRPEALERDGCADVLARLQAAQRVNPAARLLVTVAHGRRPLSPHQAGCLLVFVAQLPHARLADTLVLADGEDTYHSRHSELELQAYKEDRKLCAPEVRHLYREIFRPRLEAAYMGALFPRQAV